jgi:hypothetical protein
MIEAAMSKYSSELQRRLDRANNDDYKIADIRKWYLKQIINDSVSWHRMPPHEREFLAKLIAAFTDWQKQQLGLPGVNS